MFLHDNPSDHVVINVKKENYLQTQNNSETYLEPNHTELLTYASVRDAKSLNF